jgi:hypothetical protein
MTVPVLSPHPDTSSQTNERNAMTVLTEAVEADRALKAKHRAIWASGSYEAVAKEIVSPLGPILVQAAGVTLSNRLMWRPERATPAFLPRRPALRWSPPT